MSETSLRERVTNTLLVLYVIGLANKVGSMDDTQKLQKIVFLCEKELSYDKGRRLKALSYNFFRWHRGPFSADLNHDLTALIELGLVKPGWPIQLAESGVNLLKACEEVFEANGRFLKYIEAVVKDKAPLNSDSIKQQVYELTMTVPKLRKNMTIKDIPMKQLILFKTSDKKARAIFNLGEEWLDTLELTFSRESIDSLAKAYESAKSGRAHEFTTVQTS